MKEHYSAYEVLVKKGYFDWTILEVRKFDSDLVDKAFDAFKDFVADSARGERRVRILNAGLDNIKDYGLLKRLWYYPKTGEVEYCCGQRWADEMAKLRDCFDWKVRK